MAEIVNLRRARKNKARTEKAAAAQANRIAHGTPKAAKKLEQAKREQELSTLENKKLDSES